MVKLQSGIFFGYIMILIMPIILLVATIIAYIKLKRISNYQNVRDKLWGMGAALGIGLLVTSLIMATFILTTSELRIM